MKRQGKNAAWAAVVDLRQANVLFDYQLKQITLSLRDHAATALAVADAAQNSAEQEVVIQIWRGWNGGRADHERARYHSGRGH